MNTLKSILLSSAIISSTFGAAEAAYPSDDEGDENKRKHHRAVAAADASEGACLPRELWEVVASFLPKDNLGGLLEAHPKMVELDTVKDRETLIQNYATIIASLLFTQKPLHEVMKANGFADPRMIMSTLDIKEDVSKDKPIAGRYDQTDRIEMLES